MRLWKRSRRQWNVVEPNQHWFAKMLARRPNEYMTWGQFWRMVTLHFELAQNSYILKGIDRQGNVLELLPLLPARVRERMGENGRLFYEINALTEFERGMLDGKDNIIVPASRMIHLKGRLWNGLTGLSNVALGDPIFKLLKAISDYQTNLFNNDGKIPIVFETDQSFTGELADAAFRRLKQQLAERVRRMRVTNDPILLEAGLKAKQIAVNARDSMTAETFNAQVMRVCGLMQTPPHKIMAYESVKYDNQAAANSTTGLSNYQEAGYADNPEDLRSMPGALHAALTYWMKNGLNALADKGDIVAVRKRVNGGTHGLDECRVYFKKARQALGL
jgi:HK97 family phage portal protein